MRAISKLLEAHPIGDLLPAPIDVLLSDSDIVVPDLVIEILSPSTRLRDERLKRGLYARAGVKEYWLVDPDFKRISTSHIERAKITVRMHLRQFTQLTNDFSKKLENQSGLSSRPSSGSERESSNASKGRSVVTICHTMSWSTSS